MMWMCCCAKNRKEDENTIGGIETKLRNSGRILIEFVSEEAKLGLRENECI